MTKVATAKLPQQADQYEKNKAELSLSPIVSNAVTATEYAKGHWGEIDSVHAVGVIKDGADKAVSGDMSSMEATLAAQAFTLNAMFGELARRAKANMGENLHATETYLRLALKAQNQCRATIETLAEVKNPRSVAFVKQANFAQGHQQVNNGGQAGSLAHPNENQENKLLLKEVQDGQTLDSRGTIPASGSDKELATVEAIDRTQNGRRQSHGSA